jgi:hypothetical protein
MSLPPEMTALTLPLPWQFVDVPKKVHAPSKLPRTPPPAGLLGLDDRSGSTDRCPSREPDTDLSSFPMLPPELPDWAEAEPYPVVTTTAAITASLLGFLKAEKVISNSRICVDVN